MISKPFLKISKLTVQIRLIVFSLDFTSNPYCNVRITQVKISQNFASKISQYWINIHHHFTQFYVCLLKMNNYEKKNGIQGKTI